MSRIIALSLLLLVVAPFAFADSTTKDDHLLAVKNAEAVTHDKLAEESIDPNLMSYGYGGYGYGRFRRYGGYGYGGFRRYGGYGYGHGIRRFGGFRRYGGYHLLSDDDTQKTAELMSVDDDNKVDSGNDNAAELLSHGYGGFRRYGGYGGYGYGRGFRRYGGYGYGGFRRYGGYGHGGFRRHGYHLLSDEDKTELSANADKAAELMSVDEDNKVDGGDDKAELMSYGYGGYGRGFRRYGGYGGYGYGGYRPYGYGYRSHVRRPYRYGYRYGYKSYGHGKHLLEDETNDA